MDPRHRPPASSASRDLSSSYHNSPFRQQAPALNDAISNRRPPSTDAALEGPAHASHRRRTSETPYYPPAARASFPELGHARAQSASSLQPAWHHNHTMAPPNSPPPAAQGQPPQHHQSQSPRGYEHPPPPRPPSLPVGPPNAFPTGGRELPNLSSITRTNSGSGNSSMSISSMLGGPAPASRESQPPSHPGRHYSPHGPSPTSAPGYPPPIHASPRVHSTSAEYPPFRRPQTPDHQRPYDHRGGAGSAGPSPHGPYSSTPDVPRFSTPQGYHQRHPSAPADTSREPGRMSAGPTASGGPPKPFSVPPRHEDPYARQYAYDDRYRTDRERQVVPEGRDREGRERAYSGGAVDSRRQHMSPHELGRPESNPHQPSPYGRPPDQRDPRDQWGRPVAEQGYRATLEHQRQHPDFPPTSAPYPPHGTSPYQGPGPERYPGQHQGVPGGPPPHDPAERARFEQAQQQQQQQQHHHMNRGRSGEEAGPPPPVAYGHGGPYESPRKLGDGDRHGPNGMQRNLLALQDINRNKGRMSPLPQAVQGAQPQQPGPGAEPGIKSEFGRMFSGIGSGVGGVSSPVASGASPAFPSQGHSSYPAHREEVPSGDVGPDKTKGGGRRRKMKDDDVRDDDSSGRQTPGARANKRSKPHQHHHHQ